MLFAALCAAVAVTVSVSYRIYDPDLWQHLLVGKVIWQQHAVPRHHLWTWTMYGTPEVLPSWLFSAMVWPFWTAGGVLGLFVWRWVASLSIFGLAWVVARRMGARGVTPLVVIAVCALVYRQRSQVRPENVAAVLLALQIWILETRRHGGPDRSAWLPFIALVWANAHISYYLGFVVLAIFCVDAWLDARRTPRAGRPVQDVRRLGWMIVASALASFVNPFGWQTLAQPFEFFLYWRHEPIFLTIGELKPVVWANNLTNGLPLVLVGWPLLVLWRATRGRWDRVDAVMCAFFTVLLWFGQRFLGPYAVAAAMYLGRDAADLVQALGLRWSPMLRAAAAPVVMVALGWPEWTRPQFPIAVGFDPRWYPVAASDFIAAHGIRGRGFNPFDLGGYLLYRFWPDRSRLPFMDIHQAGTRQDRYDYAFLHMDPRAWPELEARRDFDWAMISRMSTPGGPQIEELDADSTWALVFADDVALLYVRRRGALLPVTERYGYRWMPGGMARLTGLQKLCEGGAPGCDSLVAELDRAIASSPRDAQARSLLANVELARGQLAPARAELERALQVDPFLPRGHERLGIVALLEKKPADARREFEQEVRMNGLLPGLALRMGQALRASGDSRGAAGWYRRELARDPGNQEARDSLSAIERSP